MPVFGAPDETTRAVAAFPDGNPNPQKMSCYNDAGTTFNTRIGTGMNHKNYTLKGEMAIEEILARMGGDGTWIPEASGAESCLRFFDTFDWALYRAGLTLIRSDDHYHLVGLDSGDKIASIPVAATAAPRFSDDFPPGELRTALAPLLEVRALLQVVTVDRVRHCVGLHNSDGRPLLYLAVERLTPCRRRRSYRPFEQLAVMSVKGEAEVFRRACERATALGLDSTPASVFEQALTRAGIEAANYQSKPQLQLAPDLPAREAARLLCRRLLRVMRQNEKGIIADIDTEFLHDFRVAVRRTRSLLTQTRGVFPTPETQGFLDDFAWLGEVTGPVRNLDVFLLKRKAYHELVPDALSHGVDELFTLLTERRQGALARLTAALASDRYFAVITRWQHFLTPRAMETLEPSRRAELPVHELARRTIARRHRRILKRGRKIAPESPPRALHRLRIEGKKLRYLLEFYASLFPPREIRSAVKQLKRLQDNLGDFNDLAFQIDDLVARLNRDTAATRSPTAVAALGALITSLEERKRRVRADYEHTFAAFADSQSIDLYETLF